MRVSDFLPLFEGRDAPLYHGTYIPFAAASLENNWLRPSTEHNINGEFVSGTSLSRDIRVSKRFGPIVFVLDQSLLSRNIRLVPVDYYSRPKVFANDDEMFFSDDEQDDPEFVRRRAHYAEAEEFAIGGVPNLSRYLTAIHFFEFDGWKRQGAGFPILLNHPLLKIH